MYSSAHKYCYKVLKQGLHILAIIAKFWASKFIVHFFLRYDLKLKSNEFLVRISSPFYFKYLFKPTMYYSLVKICQEPKQFLVWQENSEYLLQNSINKARAMLCSKVTPYLDKM